MDDSREVQRDDEWEDYGPDTDDREAIVVTSHAHLQDWDEGSGDE